MSHANKTKNSHSNHILDRLWDLWCVLSCIGIWPRFIEPRLLEITRLSLQIDHLPASLKKLKILQFSDLHLNTQTSPRFLERLLQRIQNEQADLIVFTGDFLCYSQLDAPKQLKTFLNRITAPYGCFAILGNHDYSHSVSVNEQGDYDIVSEEGSLITKGFKRLFGKNVLSGKTTERALRTPEHEELLSLLAGTPFQLLNNRTLTLSIGDAKLNISGLGEHMMGRCDLSSAFQQYDSRFPGLVLSHNPDSLPMLENAPGDIILCGHTHGAQVNLPWMWKKFLLMQHPHFKRGLFKLGKKWAYVNRGVGSVMPFRWFSLPEVLVLTLE